MNASKYEERFQENTISEWHLPRSCINPIQRCQCNAKLLLDILCICNHPYNSEPPIEPNPNLTIQFIEFSYCNDRYSIEKIIEKTNKYEALINDIKVALFLSLQ